MSTGRRDPVILDLAFTGADDELIKSLGMLASTGRLQNPEPWQSDLCRWLEALRENRVDPTAPQLRDCLDVSLGLQFTGDRGDHRAQWPLAWPAASHGCVVVRST